MCSVRMRVYRTSTNHEFFAQPDSIKENKKQNHARCTVVSE